MRITPRLCNPMYAMQVWPGKPVDALAEPALTRMPSARRSRFAEGRGKG